MVMLRTAAASYTTAIVAFIVMTALHLRWLHLSAHAGDVLSAYGAGLVVLGVLVGSRPYLRTGFAGLVDAVLAQDDAGYLVGPDYLRELEEQRRAPTGGMGRTGRARDRRRRRDRRLAA